MGPGSGEYWSDASTSGSTSGSSECSSFDLGFFNPDSEIFYEPDDSSSVFTSPERCTTSSSESESDSDDSHGDPFDAPLFDEPFHSQWTGDELCQELAGAVSASDMVDLHSGGFAAPPRASPTASAVTVLSHSTPRTVKSPPMATATLT